MRKQPTVTEIAQILPNIGECPEHPGFITLPFYGYRACCLKAALERIADGESDARVVATQALETTLRGVPRLTKR